MVVLYMARKSKTPRCAGHAALGGVSLQAGRAKAPADAQRLRAHAVIYAAFGGTFAPHCAAEAPANAAARRPIELRLFALAQSGRTAASATIRAPQADWPPCHTCFRNLPA